MAKPKPPPPYPKPPRPPAEPPRPQPGASIIGAGALAFALITAPTVAVAQDTTSAGYMLPHCQARNTLMSAWCHGNVQAAGYLGGALPPPYRNCMPPEIPPGQGVSVVVQYLNVRPQRWHEPFVALAVEALAQAWPCRR
jgi:hypothetical protein